MSASAYLCTLHEVRTAGYVDKQEFVQWMSQRRNNSDVEVELLEAFNVFDKDGDGRFPPRPLVSTERMIRAFKVTVNEAVLMKPSRATTKC